MAKTFKIREKSTGKEISADWQNAFELVNHGYWEWVHGNTSKNLKAAQSDARNNPGTEGFDREVPETDDDDSDDDYNPPKPQKSAPVSVAVEDEDADEDAEDADALEDMTREELFAEAGRLGLSIDKRTGSKNLISAIRAATATE